MSQQIDTSRRRALQFLAGAGLLPMASSLARASTMSLAPDGGGSSSSAALVVDSVSFTPMAAPTLANAAAMATTSVRSSMVVKYADGSSKTFALGYETFFVTGDMVPDGAGGTTLAGGHYDIDGNPIKDANGEQFYSDCPDGTSLLSLDNPTVSGVTGNAVFCVVQFEYTSRNAAGDSMYGKLPSPVAVLTLDQDRKTGQLKLVKYHNVDTGGVNGLWITCGASLSPWGTHLSSEEYEPDATTAATDPQFLAYSRNLHANASAVANPYHYGHMPEVTVNPDGTGSIRKHYCMGRISHELVQVMPDERTVLMGDDTTNAGLFMFIADAAKDLSAGVLYVARWTQTSPAGGPGGGAGTLKWVRLGHATSTEIKTLADALGAGDIVDVRTADPADASHTKIGFGGRSNWVKFVAGQEKAAAFLETHRYAAFKGGSLAFTKMEGVTVNVADRKAYLAMSRIDKTMTDGSTDVHVARITAGAVYELSLAASQTDTEGVAIDSAWVPVDMAAVPELVGEDLAAPDALGNRANADRVSNPDNLKFSEELRTLFVGEDSGQHVNNFLWAYNVDSRSLSRILSCPAGAESTGLQAVHSINGFTYINSNFQHAGDWGSIHAVVRASVGPLIDANYKRRSGAAVGYITGMPALG